MAELPLGYDLRFPFAHFVPIQWTAGRRARFLLRPDIARPASVDTLAWPSCFAWPGSFIARHPDGLPRLPLEDGPARWDELDLWPDAPAMWRPFEGRPGPPEGAVPILIGLDGEGDRADAFQPAEPPPEPWRLMGYDVADDALTSGLVNCGYEDMESQGLRRTWGPRLNRFGLFGRASDADSFRAVCDARVPEHSPFRLFALRRGPA